MPTLPPHLIKRTPKAENIRKIRALLGDDTVHTVCESAKCPNIGECFSKKTVTFMILGNICTRSCAFCGVEKGKPSFVDKEEPKKISDAVKKLGLDYVVLTSVTRDDLPDGGASHFAAAINAIRKDNPGIKIEVLIPDLHGNNDSLDIIIEARPNIINHNLETVPRLYSNIRPQADYKRSLKLLKSAKNGKYQLYTKSGIMLGLGETKDEVLSLMDDLRKNDCDILTVGQYLRPSREQTEVVDFIAPEVFEELFLAGSSKGFKKVFSGPFVRSSYRAGEMSGF